MLSLPDLSDTFWTFQVVGSRIGGMSELKQKFGQMKIIVLAKKSLLPYAACPQAQTENTGYVGLRNKGGIAARFDFMVRRRACGHRYESCMN